MINKTAHIPVLLEETINALSVKNENFYIDATFGLGGYTRAILERKNCRVLGVDRDPDVKPAAEAIKVDFRNRFYFQNARFSQIEKLIEPSILIAEKGFKITETLAKSLETNSLKLAKRSSTKEIFFKDGSTLKTGDLLVQKAPW